jgi:ubiquinone/menaquinone biosynthesis C-methylase UbiE
MISCWPLFRPIPPKPSTEAPLILFLWLNETIMSNAPRASVPPDVEIQRRYYTNTASRYDTMHANEGAADPFCQSFVHSLFHLLKIRSVLDVGTATGRGLRNLQQALPGAFVCGVEPVAALLQHGRASGEIAGVSVLQGSGEALPFPDNAFDAVCEFATLHHVPAPNVVVAEMLRVARRVVVIGDSNRFGQGPWPARLFKLSLYKLGLWRWFDFLRTRGKRYQFSEGDGLFYSYSVYDSYDLVAAWADRVLLMPSESGQHGSWLHPLLTAKGVILIAIRDS